LSISPFFKDLAVRYFFRLYFGYVR